MKIENQLGLPDPIVRAITNDPYSKDDCDYTPTSLIRPVRIASLARKWDKHMVEDASDRLWALMGQGIHSILERAAGPGCIVETRFYAELGGKRIGGRIDYYEIATGKLSDYKWCSRWVVVDGVKPEWLAQSSINAWLLRKNKRPVISADIVALFRDWSKLAAFKKSDYPQKGTAVLPVNLWDTAKTEAYILERIKAHEEGKDNPPVCTPEERWERPEKFAVMQKGKKRAMKLYATKETALGAAAALDSSYQKYFVEVRPGESVRCLHYCPVVSYCSFGRELVREAAGQ